MKVLWAPWRMTLIAGPKPRGCIFCRLPRGKDLRANLVLDVERSAFVILNRFPYNGGHLMVAPRRHVGELERLTASDRRALDEALHRAATIVKREYRPDGMNIGMNVGAAAGAGVADHLHWHVVPRWSGDTNFMPSVGDVKVMPEHLLETYDRLRPYFSATRRQTARRRGAR